MYAATPRTLVLAGPLGSEQIRNLSEYCGRLHAVGLRTVHLDLGGVTDCDPAGLDGLSTLVAGGAQLTITVSGARWNQFMPLLAAASIADVQARCADVRQLVGPAAGRSTSDG